MARLINIIVFLVILTAFFLAACEDEEERRADIQASTDTWAIQNEIDAQNRANLERAQAAINIAPQISITSPSNGATISQAPLVVQYTVTDTASSSVLVSEVTIREVHSDLAISMCQPAQVNAGSGICSWSGFASLTPGDYEIVVYATDAELSNVAFARITKG